MKKLFLIFLLSPFFVVAQNNTKKTIQARKKSATTVKPADGFVIKGEVSGFPNGTAVALLNGETGVPETQTTIENNHFTFKGKMATPDFKVILFNKQPPYITLFLDNSAVKIAGTKASLETASVTGSPSNNDYTDLNKIIKTYHQLFEENAVYDSAASVMAIDGLDDFVKGHTASYVTPLAIIRSYQLSEDIAKMESMYNKLASRVQITPMGSYLAQQITEAKRNAVGTVLPDFTQPDTAGTPVSLSSLRGKYVLVDFWASWCRPCRQENPNVVANYNKFKDRNFTVLGVSLDKAKPAWIDAINMDGLTWAHVSDLQGWSNSVAQQLKIFSIPQNFLVGPDGKIVAKNLRGPALEQKLNALLK